MRTCLLTTVLAAGVVLAVGTAPVGATVWYSENFNSGPGVWETFGTDGTDHCLWRATGGVGNSGHMEAYRAINYYSGIRTLPGQILYRNWIPDVGEQFRVSYDIKFISGANGGMAFSVSGGDDPAHYAYWKLDLFMNGNAPTEWTRIYFDVDVNWTKAEAQAQGWQETFAHNGGGSWRGIWEDGAGIRDYSTTFFSQASDRVRGPNNYTAIDNVRVETIPAPATWILLCAGGAWGLLRRRRSAGRTP